MCTWLSSIISLETGSQNSIWCSLVLCERKEEEKERLGKGEEKPSLIGAKFH